MLGFTPFRRGESATKVVAAGLSKGLAMDRCAEEVQMLNSFLPLRKTRVQRCCFHAFTPGAYLVAV